jgi:hypothetical protein
LSLRSWECKECCFVETKSSDTFQGKLINEESNQEARGQLMPDLSVKAADTNIGHEGDLAEMKVEQQAEA